MPEPHPLVADLRRRRIDARLSQADVGAVLGCGQRAVSYYETGVRPLPLGVLAEWADLFGLTLGWVGMDGAIS